MAEDKPTILIFSYGEVEDDFEELKEKANVYQASLLQRDAPSNLLANYPQAQAVWILAPSIVNPEFRGLSAQLVGYACNGGIVVLGGLFSLGVPASDFDKWMEEIWDLPWRYSQFKKKKTAIFGRHAEGPNAFWRNGLAAAYCHEGIFLENVEEIDSWYAISRRAVPKPRSRKPGKIKVLTSVAFTEVGEGWLGWTGDFHNRDETIAAVRAMMQLNKTPQEDHVPSAKLLRRLFEA
ncbi:hypothetical protein Hte_010327 [Hypoxylon texense]